jgi:type III secretory pathway component EscU
MLVIWQIREFMFQTNCLSVGRRRSSNHQHTTHRQPLPTIKMRTTIRLIITFYKSFAFASNLITFSCIYLINLYGKNAIYIIQALFWFKIITLALIFYYIQNYKKDEFYYYKNLGLTKKHLWISTFTFDFILFLILFILTLKAQ